MNIVDELTRFESFCREKNKALPVPNYLFIDSYGRRAKDYIEQFKAVTSRNEAFEFAVSEEKEKLYVSKLISKMEVHSKLGKEYDGIIIVKLDCFEVDEFETKRLVEYMGKIKNKVYFLFELENGDCLTQWRELIARSFFIREIEPDAFTVEEQKDIADNIFCSFDVRLSDEAEVALEEWLDNRDWSENDSMQAEIENIVNEIIYEDAISNGLSEISYEGIMKVLEKRGPEPEVERRIGFAV